MENDCECSNGVLIFGTAYTPTYDDDYDGTLFSHEQMNEEFAERMKNLPVYIEHDASVPIGKVKDAFINERRQLETILHVNSSKEINKRIPPTLYKDPENGGKGFFNALSLGNDITFNFSPDKCKTTIDSNVPTEVSIVRNGNRPLTEIKDYWIVPETVEDIDDYINNHIKPKIRY